MKNIKRLLPLVCLLTIVLIATPLVLAYISSLTATSEGEQSTIVHEEPTAVAIVTQSPTPAPILPHIITTPVPDEGFYFINSEGEEVHSSRRSMTASHVEVLIRHDFDVLEYVPGTESQMVSASAKITYIDNIQEILHGSSASIYWYSSNEQVLKAIQYGHFYVVGAGTTIIIAEYRGVRGEKEVTVYEGTIVGVELWPDELILIQGGSGEGRNIFFTPQLFPSVYTSRGSFFSVPRSTNPLRDTSAVSIKSGNTNIVTAMK